MVLSGSTQLSPWAPRPWLDVWGTGTCAKHQAYFTGNVSGKSLGNGSLSSVCLGGELRHEQATTCIKKMPSSSSMSDIFPRKRWKLASPTCSAISTAEIRLNFRDCINRYHMMRTLGWEWLLLLSKLPRDKAHNVQGEAHLWYITVVASKDLALLPRKVFLCCCFAAISRAVLAQRHTHSLGSKLLSCVTDESAPTTTNVKKRVT